MSSVLPKVFITSLAGVQGFDKEAFLAAHENSKQITSVRLNPLKPSPAVNSLPLATVVPWCAQGKYLSERPSFTLDPIFHGGAYYVQEASSMFLHHILSQIYEDTNSPRRVLDLCAAPGGKTTLLAAALPDSFIVSNEVIRTRVGVLAENVSKWGSENVIVTNNDPADFKKLPDFFNLMVIDAPCSGSGLFRKDAGAIQEWSEENVEICSFRQQRIIADAIGSLKQNGYLIYSTCSYSPQEDEAICDWLIEKFALQPVKIATDESWGITESFSAKHDAPAYRFYPDKLKGEGFFIACFQQTNEVKGELFYNYKVQSAGRQNASFSAAFLKNHQDYFFNDAKEIVIAFLKKWEPEVAVATKLLNVRKTGVAVGTPKGKDFIPHHEFALSDILSPDIPFVNLKKEDALKYLKRQDFTLQNAKLGWIICRYEGINLGWIKVLPHRVNNYYPVNWRILKP